MTIGDCVHYVAIGNPISRAIIGTTASMFGIRSTSSNSTIVKAAAATSKAVGKVMPPLWQVTGAHYNFIRFAGLSGASAVILAAIGSHKLHTMSDKGDCKAVFDTANRFHFFHSLALMGVPLTKYPLVTGILMANGMLLFSGILYYQSFTGDKRFSRFAPYGGTCLILAWLTLLL